MKGVWLDEQNFVVTIVGAGRYNFRFMDLAEAKIGREVIQKHYDKAMNGRNRTPMNWEKIDKELAKKGIRYF